jgi:hypothetical protein
MGLTKTQETIWEKARALGSGDQAVVLTDEVCAYLIGRIAHDLELAEHFPEIPAQLAPFFASVDLDSLRLAVESPRGLFERLVSLNADADMFFACLAALHKARLKYETILETQPIPTLEQVGPRGLLQYGKLTPSALAGLLFWRKWFYDIDNRAGQETGYLFEPVIAHAIGGTPAPANSSPVKRATNKSKGRQVDCLRERRAYELKIRVTIAASGQGRWREELDFPVDCRESGYVPVLVVLDGTSNPKLTELSAAFEREGGEVYTGDLAWEHLESLAGDTMSRFLDKYVRAPINKLIEEEPTALPELTARLGAGTLLITVGDEALSINRREGEPENGRDETPDDAVDKVIG